MAPFSLPHLASWGQEGKVFRKSREGFGSRRTEHWRPNLPALYFCPGPQHCHNKSSGAWKLNAANLTGHLSLWPFPYADKGPQGCRYQLKSWSQSSMVTLHIVLTKYKIGSNLMRDRHREREILPLSYSDNWTFSALWLTVQVVSIITGRSQWAGDEVAGHSEEAERN